MFGKFAVRTLYELLTCETLMSAKQAINGKLGLQGSVAAYLSYGEDVNNQIKKGLLLSLRVKIF